MSHQQCAHRKRSHRNVSTFDFRRAIRLVFEAGEQFLEIVQLFDSLVEVLEGQSVWLSDSDVSVVSRSLQCILVRYC